jgi:hypothetical protein
MSPERTCQACGRTAYDVTPRLVEIPEPEQAETTVFLPVDRRDRSTPVPVAVRERFVTELRCADKYACQERTEEPS